MKKFILAIALAFSFTILQTAPSKASTQTLVIIDNMFDSSHPEIKNNIIHEVCITSGDFCSGRLMQTEGIGAASAPSSLVYKDSQTRHGTDVALVAKKIDPNVRLILIRTSGINTRGLENKVRDTHLYDKHFNWVLSNKDKYNIVAALIAKAPKEDDGACNPKKVQDKNFYSLLQKISLSGIAVIAGSGNNGWTGKTNFPSCITEVVSVGSMMDWQPGIFSSSNVSSSVDFFSIGGWNLSTSRVTGTSFSSAALAGYWSKNYQGSFQKTYDYLKSISKNESHARIVSYSFLDVNK